VDNPLNHPIVLFAVFLVVLSLSAQLGAYFERKKWSPLKDEEREPFKVVFGATLTLLGLIIGFSFSMALTRYDQRKNNEAEEANAIGTEYLRTELLPTASTDRAKGLLRQYLEQRILFYEEEREGNVPEIIARTIQLQRALWSVVRSVAAAEPTPVIALATSGMNDVLNSEGYAQAAWTKRIPVAAWVLMAVTAMCSCVLMSYSAHNARARLLTILPLVLSIAFYLIAETDSPRHGVVRVIPQNLIRLSQSLGAH
jgi:hypothetical protein